MWLPILAQLLISLTPPPCTAPACYSIKPEPTLCAEGICDITRPLLDAIAYCEANPPIPDDPIGGSRVGCRFELPAGRFLITETITLCRQHELVGQGGRFWGARTRLEFLGGYTGIHLKFFDECIAQGRGAGADGSVIGGFGMVSTMGKSKEPSYGIQVEAARVKLEQLWIRGFVQGIRIAADVRGNPRSNANRTHVEDVRVDVNEHAGIWIDGGDTNAGLLIMTDVSGNCRYWERWKKKLGPCRNIHESSFLGTTIVAAHTARCIDSETSAKCEGYALEDDTQRSVCVGCYSEHDQKPNRLSQNSLALGGQSGWEGSGGWLFGQWMNRLVLRNDQDPDNVVQLELGSVAAPGAAWQVRALRFEKGAWPLSLAVLPSGWFSMRLANSEAWSIFKVAADAKSAGHPLGTFHLVPAQDRYLSSKTKKWLCPLSGGLCGPPRRFKKLELRK